jgi:hypothetical protein
MSSLVCAHLARVQKLELEMEVANSRFYDVEQKAQLAWVCGALIRVKELEIGSTTLLKSLVVVEKNIWVSMLNNWDTFRQTEIAHIEEILRLLRGLIQGLMVFDQKVAFD